ncbi:hypothetical protein HM131_16155 [Halobacillus mangrovi]|uniref:Uncharacterized protein n=1 Tax=Halobacillus mangrovi TaxID=402384 RepID=A0A1W5ZYD3_9BACI|nr:hypothetical protein HM131_16155 [Halobacillus mangrovi]
MLLFLSFYMLDLIQYRLFEILFTLNGFVRLMVVGVSPFSRQPIYFLEERTRFNTGMSIQYLTMLIEFLSISTLQIAVIKPVKRF